MQVIHHPSDVVLAPNERAVVTIGSYDGVHLGHKQIISALKQSAVAHNAKSVVIAFHPRPAVIFQGISEPDYLTTLPEKQKILEKAVWLMWAASERTVCGPSSNA